MTSYHLDMTTTVYQLSVLLQDYNCSIVLQLMARLLRDIHQCCAPKKPSLKNHQFHRVEFRAPSDPQTTNQSSMDDLPTDHPKQGHPWID